MRTARALCRLAAITAITLVSYVILMAGTLILLLAGRSVWRWRNFMVRSWARIIAAVIGMSITVHGTAPSDQPYMVSNHLSYLDIPLLFTQIGCVFVAKAELRGWPVLGFLMRSVGTVFVDRSNKKDVLRVNALIEESILQGKTVAVFPEGTTSSGNDVLPFKPPLLEYPAQTGFPVSCATIHYSTPETEEPAHLSVCWWGDMGFAGHFFNLLKLSRIDATIEFGPAPVRRNNRKELAQELWAQVKQLFVPTAA